MVEEWQLKQLERRLDRLERRLDRDRERVREEQNEDREERPRRVARISECLLEVAQTAGLAAAITYLLWG
jgi:hypothetical protein